MRNELPLIQVAVLNCGRFAAATEGKRGRTNSSCSMGTTPTTDASQYPSMEELLGKFEEIRAATLAHLNTLSDKDLDKPSHAPAEFGPPFATVGACFAAMSTHMSFHAGQVADARRAAGRGPLMA